MRRKSPVLLAFTCLALMFAVSGQNPEAQPGVSCTLVFPPSGGSVAGDAMAVRLYEKWEDPHLGEAYKLRAEWSCTGYGDPPSFYIPTSGEFPAGTFAPTTGEQFRGWDATTDPSHPTAVYTHPDQSVSRIRVGD